MIPPKKKLEDTVLFVAELFVVGAMEGVAVGGTDGVASTTLVFTILT